MTGITIKINFKTSALLMGLLSLPILSMAADTTTSTRSINYSINSETNEQTKIELLKQSDTKSGSSIVLQGFRKESENIANPVLSSVSNYAGDFSIYNVTTDLISDDDYDNFYHGFSVTIDADTVYNSAYVYVKLYLSFEGGPWNYYASSDAYHIYAASSQDAFVIETELADGFPAGYYDVRIELYDADYNEWLLSYGPYDDSSISAIPLEDSFRDSNLTYPVETEVIIAGTGSMNFWLLITGFLLLSTLRLKATTKSE